MVFEDVFGYHESKEDRQTDLGFCGKHIDSHVVQPLWPIQYAYLCRLTLPFMLTPIKLVPVGSAKIPSDILHFCLSW